MSWADFAKESGEGRKRGLSPSLCVETSMVLSSFLLFSLFSRELIPDKKEREGREKRGIVTGVLSPWTNRKRRMARKRSFRKKDPIVGRGCKFWQRGTFFPPANSSILFFPNGHSSGIGKLQFGEGRRLLQIIRRSAAGQKKEKELVVAASVSKIGGGWAGGKAEQKGSLRPLSAEEIYERDKRGRRRRRRWKQTWPVPLKAN